jgi:hypothetical protein
MAQTWGKMAIKWLPLAPRENVLILGFFDVHTPGPDIIMCEGLTHNH